MTKTVFVTGGAGYVGAHCCKAFAEAGWRVVVYDNLSRGWRDFVRWGILIQDDILDLPALTAAIRTAQPDAVVHFAALAYVGESISEPGLYYRVNSTGALNVLDAMRATGVDKLVFSSTCATYGVPQVSPIDETHPQNPISPYGWSKLMVEKMLTAYEQAFGIRSIALRYFNAAGADPEGEVGERHEPETHVIPLAFRAATMGDFPFTIHGVDYDTPDGTAIRDYIHVTDLADAHLKALSRLSTGAPSDVFNLGTGTGISVKEIADAAEKVVGKPMPRRFGSRRRGDPAALVASANKARSVLGWVLERSSIEQIMSDAWSWYSKDAASRTNAMPCAD